MNPSLATRRRFSILILSLRPTERATREDKARLYPIRRLPMTKSKKEIVLEVLKRAFIDRDPTVVEQYFGANYKQHNPVIPDGPSAIAEMIPTLTALTYEPGM